MSDDGVLRRFPALIRKGNGILVSFLNGIWTIAVDLQTMSITPSGEAAPVNLADAIATLRAHDTAQQYITVVDDGFFDIPGSGNAVTIDDGNF